MFRELCSNDDDEEEEDAGLRVQCTLGPGTEWSKDPERAN